MASGKIKRRAQMHAGSGLIYLAVYWLYLLMDLSAGLRPEHKHGGVEHREGLSIWVKVRGQEPQRKTVKSPESCSRQREQGPCTAVAIKGAL